MRSSRHLTHVARLYKYSNDMLEIQNFNVYKKSLRSGLEKKPGMSFVLTTEQRSQCETVAHSFPSYFVETQINNQTYKQNNMQLQADIEL